jgi:hypothetical protein
MAVDISAEAAQGVMGLTIDSFDSPQMVMASSATFPTGNSALADANVLGRERDLFIRLLSGMGVVSLESELGDGSV